jgi:hypothetical protein
MRITWALGTVVGLAVWALSGGAAAQPTPPNSPQQKTPAPAGKGAPAPAPAKPVPKPAGKPATPKPAVAAPGSAVVIAPAPKRQLKRMKGLRKPGLAVVDAPPKPRPPAAPPGSFEALLATSEDVGDLARTLEPFTELCNEELDMTRRQCEVVRGYLRTVLARRVFRSAVEPGALVIGPYTVRAGGRTVTLRGCVACTVPVPGDRRHYVTVRPPQKLGSPEFKGLDLTSVRVPHASAHVAEIWQRDVGSKLQTELVYKLGAPWTQKAPKQPKPRKGAPPPPPPAWEDGTGEVRGLSLQLLGYRVYSRCSGEVLVSSPKSAFPVPVVPAADCPKIAPKVAASQPLVRQPDPRWPYVLSVGDIRRSMDVIRGQVQACYMQFQIPGEAELELEIGGLDGNVVGVKVSGLFEDTPTGDCIAAAVSVARFPNFRAKSMKVPYSFFLR